VEEARLISDDEETGRKSHRVLNRQADITCDALNVEESDSSDGLS
jgi:hypothetical protein